MNHIGYIIHLSIYYIAWIICVTLAIHNYAWWSTLSCLACAVLQISWERHLHPSRPGLMYLVVLVTTLGIIIDSLLVWFDWLQFTANPFAPYMTSPWMISIWVSFSIYLFSIMNHFINRYIVFSITSGVEFTLAYIIGSRMNAIFFPQGYWTCILIGLIWAILMPFCLYLYKNRDYSL